MQANAKEKQSLNLTPNRLQRCIGGPTAAVSAEMTELNFPTQYCAELRSSWCALSQAAPANS
jgi:hypothetical protein